MKVRAFTDADSQRWDDAVGSSCCGTFLHTRRFLSYHGSRFEDRSVLCEDAKGRLTGVFPAALAPGDPACVTSHPGITYGGLLYGEDVTAGGVEEMMAGILEHYRSSGLERMEYRAVPPHLHTAYSQADLYCLWRRGAQVARRELWNVLSVRERCGYSKMHERSIRRARSEGIAVGAANAVDAYREFYDVLKGSLHDRHGLRPVHTLEEMLTLRDRFPDGISLWLARDAAGPVLAGCWIFTFSKQALHTQYIAASAEGLARRATHLLFDGIIREAQNNGIAFVSFGASTEDGGQRLNEGLFDFKAGFGPGAVCHDTYRLPLHHPG